VGRSSSVGEAHGEAAGAAAGLNAAHAMTSNKKDRRNLNVPTMRGIANLLVLGISAKNRFT
jgi:hypothetical protein